MPAGYAGEPIDVAWCSLYQLWKDKPAFHSVGIDDKEQMLYVYLYEDIPEMEKVPRFEGYVVRYRVIE